MDRLAELIQQSLDLELPINWRIVGASVIDSLALPSVFSGLLEPPVFDSRHLTAVFQWADVMILLSDYEGVPLSILEAQRLGVVVIATNVGAISEIISNGRNGLLVDRERAVDQTVGLLKLLSQTPAWRLKMAVEGSKVPGWKETTAGFIDLVTKMVEVGKRSSAETPATEAVKGSDREQVYWR
jgi:glycosyltransferase involved in cell wall biosynthesis